MNRIKFFMLALAVFCFIAAPVNAGINDRFSKIELDAKNYAIFPEIAAPSGNPATNHGWVYVKDLAGVSTLFFEGDNGAVTNLLTSSGTLNSAYLNGNTIVVTTAGGDLEIDLSQVTNEVKIANLFAGAQANALNIDAEVAQAITNGIIFSCTAGTFTDAIDASHASITNALNVGANVIIGTNAQIDFSEFDVAAATGSVTIDDDANLGSLTVEGSILDINSLTFVGAGEIKTAAASALTLSVDDGATAAEDLIIVANNIALTAVGKLSLTPDAALAVALDLTDADIATAIDVGANDIVGTTGLINFTNFDVDAAGNVTCVDLSASGTVTIGALAQDALVPASAAPHGITLDGAGTGGVIIAGTSTGTVTLGGGATLVNLPATVDLTLAGGVISLTDTANSNAVTITNNTMTTASAIVIVANAVTSGNVISVTADGLVDGNMLYLDSLAAGLTTGNYINCYDGAASDFTVGLYGTTLIAGNASGTDALTLTNGDILVSAGHIDITTGTFTVGTGSVAIATNGNFSSARGGIQLDSVDDDNSYIKRNQAVTAAPLLELESTNVLDDQAVLLVDQNATGAIDTITITTDATGNADAIDLTMTGVDADVLAITVPAAYAGQIIQSDLLAWVGTAGQGGIIDIVTTAAATAEVGQGIRLNYLSTGASGAAVLGKGLHVHANAGAQAGESLVYLDTLFNTAMHINNNGVSADGIKFDVQDAYTGQGIVADLGPWLGTTNEGFIDLLSDNAASVAAGQFIRLRNQGTGQHAGAIGGTMIFMEDDAVAPAAGTSYVMYIDATNIEAIHVDTGKVLVDETVTATGGVSTGNAADSFLLTDTVALTNGQIIGLAGAPKELIAAPGAGKFIEVLSAVLILDYAGTNVFTCGGADDLVIQYNTTGVDITASIETTGWIDQAADQATLVNAAGIATAPLANIVNRAIELFNTGAEIAGNAGGDNLMKVKITYRIHDDAV